MFPSFYPIILRGTSAAHANTNMLPLPSVLGVCCFGSDIDGAAEYDLDYREFSRVICALWDPRVATPQRDCNTRQEWSSPTHQHITWGRSMTLPAQCQVTMFSQRVTDFTMDTPGNSWHRI